MPAADVCVDGLDGQHVRAAAAADPAVAVAKVGEWIEPAADWPTNRPTTRPTERLGDWTWVLSIDGTRTHKRSGAERRRIVRPPLPPSSSLFCRHHTAVGVRQTCRPAAMSSPSEDVVELNVGGVLYTTSAKTLTHDADSLLAAMFSRVKLVDGAGTTSTPPPPLPVQHNGRAFIDRDGVLFRYILDYLRNDGRLLLPEGFQERRRLLQEAEYFRLEGLARTLRDAAVRSSPARLSAVSTSERGHIIVGYRGTFALGRDGGGGVADVKFRKLWRILVSGRVSLCRQVFGDALNDSRDPDRGGDDADRYSARFFLRHSFIEQAFDPRRELVQSSPSEWKYLASRSSSRRSWHTSSRKVYSRASRWKYLPSWRSRQRCSKLLSRQKTRDKSSRWKYSASSSSSCLSCKLLSCRSPFCPSRWKFSAYWSRRRLSCKIFSLKIRQIVPGGNTSPFGGLAGVMCP